MLSAFLALIDRESDQTKFEQIFEKYHNYVYNIARQILGDYHCVQDAVQETFFRIAISIKQFDDIDSRATTGLVALIARNESIRIYQRNNKIPVDFIDDYDTISTDSEIDQNISVDYILDKISELDEKYATVLMLKCKYKFTTQVIADILGLNESTVKTRLRRSRIMLAKKLNEESHCSISTKKE